MINDPLTALLFAPALCCFFWFLMLDVFGKKKSPQTALMILSILFGIREYINALCFTLLEPGKIIAYIDIVGQFATFLIYPCIIIYILTLRGKEIKKSLVVLSTLPAILAGTIATVIFKIMGSENASIYIGEIIMTGETSLTGSVYDVTTDLLNTSFYALVIIGQILCIVYAIHTLIHNDYKFGDAWRMIGGKQEMSSINLICVLITLKSLIGIAVIFVPWSVIYNNIHAYEVLCLAYAFLLFAFFYVGTFFMEQKVNLQKLRRPSDPISHPDNFLNLESGEVLVRKVTNESKNGLLERFRTHIETERHFLDPDISIESVTSAIGTNRTYISMMLKTEMHMPFRTYINILRLEEAKKLLIANPDYILDSIAQSCGFANDSQLVKKFKELEGKTPREWLSEQIK